MFELFQPTHLLFVLLVALVALGPDRLMEVSRGLGRILRGVREFKEELVGELAGGEEPRRAEQRPLPEKTGPPPGAAKGADGTPVEGKRTEENAEGGP